MEEVSHLGCLDLRNKVPRQKKGPWRLGEREANETGLRETERGGLKHVWERERESFVLRFYHVS